MDDQTLNLVTAIATSLSAVGTIGAVIVALVLARRDEQIRLGIAVATGGMLKTSRAGTRSRFEILISIANLGRRPVQIVSIGWELGYFEKKYLYQVFEPDQDSQRPPTKLTDGDPVIYIVPLAAFNKEFPGHIMSLSPFERKFAIRSMRLVVNTAVGKTFKVRPHFTLREHLEKLMRERQQDVPVAAA